MRVERENYSLRIQCDWNGFLRDPEGKVWVSCKTNDQQSIFGEMKVNHSTRDRSASPITASDGFAVMRVAERTITVCHTNHVQPRVLNGSNGLISQTPRQADANNDDPQLIGAGFCNCCATFVAPIAQFGSIHKMNKAITCMDVSPDTSLGCSYSNDELVIWETARGVIRRQLKGHVSDVYTCKFFPSGVVILSGGADMRLRIWSAETAECAAVLVGHKSAILDSAIIDRGRNVLSCSRDGSVLLWDCGTAQQICDVFQLENSVSANGLSIAAVSQSDWSRPRTEGEVGPDFERSEREFGTLDKVAIVAGEDGILYCLDLFNRLLLGKINCRAAVNACVWFSSTIMLAGCSDGSVQAYDVRKLSRETELDSNDALRIWRRTSSPVLSLSLFGRGFWASNNDGYCSFYTMETELGDREVLQLTGPDYDSVYKVVSDSNKNLFTCSRDGQIRKYVLPNQYL